MAKNNKGGLGRGLNSLIGGYEAAMEQVPTPAAPAEKSDSPASDVRTPQPSPAIEREVIREEDLPQEDRAVIDVEKKEYDAVRMPRPSSEMFKVGTAVRDVVAKKELIEENDGVVIKGVVERVAKESAATASPSAKPAPAQNVSVMEGRSIASAAVTDKENVSQDAMPATDEVPIEMVRPNPNQPRMHFNKEELQELSTSIEKDGLLQPILVREVEGVYEIIAGERRWQACQLAGMKKVPVRIKEADDMKVLELALIENLQRSDLNPIEEAYGYKRMMERGGRTQSEVAAAVSKGRSTIANALRLLDLPEEAQQLLYEEKITAGHARAILSIPTEEGREKLTKKLKEEKLSVREAESIARLFAGRAKAASQPPKPPMPKFFKTAARTLGNELGTKVRIRSANGKNKLEIEFKDEEDLQRLLDRMHESE